MGLFSGKRVVLGVSGSIAAYKAVSLARMLVQGGATVTPVLTNAASQFVGPTTFSVICGRPTITDMWAPARAGIIDHVEVAASADVIVLAPATADLITRVALGRADDPLAAICLSSTAPLLIAPAMEEGMWEGCQPHVETLIKRGAVVIPPGVGSLASGREGAGRFPEPEVVAGWVENKLAPSDLSGMRIAVTAGPTRAYFDPVRFITNPSTGKMGYEIARAAARRDATVKLISGPTTLAPPIGVGDGVGVETTSDLLAACEAATARCDALIMAAAPVDFAPASVAATKLKKAVIADEDGRWCPIMEPTNDVLATVTRASRRFVAVGFAAETSDVRKNAIAKLHKKSLDMIVANDIGKDGVGFGSDTNEVEIFFADGRTSSVPLGPKREVAEVVVTAVAREIARRQDLHEVVEEV